MLEFLLDQNIDVPALLQARETNNTKKMFIPFSPMRKRSLQAHLVEADKVRIVIKGAPEILVPKCTKYVNGDGQEEDLGGEW